MNLSSEILKVWISPYELKLKQKNRFRSGALLKVEFTDGKTGHADLHPWPEKGEASLEVHLKLLKEKKFTLLLERTIAIARVEALAVAKKINLLSSLNIPLSHYLISDIETFFEADKMLAQGFKVFKVKLKSPLKRQTEKLLDLMRILGSVVKWRVDFHDHLNEWQWKEWIQEYIMKFPTRNLDFIEVPVNYKEKIWLKSKRNPFLALDVWGGENTLPVAVLVWKSSRKSVDQLLKKRSAGLFQRVIFTHSLSHPLDQLSSAYFAAQFYKIEPRLKEVCGLIQRDFYETHKCTLPDTGSFFPCLSGTGWGFDQYLNRLSWKKVF